MLAAIVVAIYFAVLGCISLVRYAIDCFSGADEEAEVSIVQSPEMMRCDSIMAHRIDSVLHRPLLLDTNNIAISVYDITSQTRVFSYHEHESRVPASCQKIITAVTALKTLGMDHNYSTSLLVRGVMHRDTLVGTLLLQADDDPLFESFDGLITKMKRRGIRHVRGNVIVSLAREDTLRPHPQAKTWDILYSKTPMLLRGKKYVERQFRYALSVNKVTVRKDNTVNSKLAKGAMGGGKYHYVATVKTPLRNVITPMLIHSSNTKADALFYHIDQKAGLFTDHRMHWEGTHYVETFIKQLMADKDVASMDYTFRGEPAKGDTLRNYEDNTIIIRDGSGLSPENRLTARFLIDILLYIYNDKALRDYFTNEALASAGDPQRCGSLMLRMYRPEYRDRLYCKTGTMVTIGTSSLAGYLKGADGHWYAFSIINSNSPVYESRKFQDILCKAMMK